MTLLLGMPLYMSIPCLVKCQCSIYGSCLASYSCEYLFPLKCENLNDAEHMTWVIINHVNDLIDLSHEPPVQDFIR